MAEAMCVYTLSTSVGIQYGKRSNQIASQKNTKANCISINFIKGV